jgi:hypothetical protein
VGGTLEHYLLWWASFPLACRPVSCAKYLREYLMLIQPDDMPEPILSTLKSLGEILTVHAGKCSSHSHLQLPLPLPITHSNNKFYLFLLVYFVVGTTWDKDFRICLVLSSLRVDQIYDKSSEFYVPEEQVSRHSRNFPMRI